MVIKSARGLRNNNPANIRRGSAWKGLSLVQSDRFFCQFDTIEYGIRAFFVLMHTYKYKHKLSTIGEVLYRFAPLCENNTFAYVAHCCKYIRENGYSNCDIVDQTHVNVWFNSKNPTNILRVFARAVFLMETGREFSDEEIQKGINLL